MVEFSRAASVSLTVINSLRRGESSGPPSSTPLSNEEHCLHGRQRKVTKRGRFLSCASKRLFSRSVLQTRLFWGAGLFTDEALRASSISPKREKFKRIKIKKQNFILVVPMFNLFEYKVRYSDLTQKSRSYRPA